MAFTPIGDALRDKIKKDKHLKKQVETNSVLEAAADVFGLFFGSERAIHVKPLFLKNRTLTVTCSSSAVAQEIRLGQMEIVTQINDKLGAQEIDRIRYLA